MDRYYLDLRCWALPEPGVVNKGLRSFIEKVRDNRPGALVYIFVDEGESTEKIVEACYDHIDGDEPLMWLTGPDKLPPTDPGRTDFLITTRVRAACFHNKLPTEFSGYLCVVDGSSALGWSALAEQLGIAWSGLSSERLHQVCRMTPYGTQIRRQQEAIALT